MAECGVKCEQTGGCNYNNLPQFRESRALAGLIRVSSPYAKIVGSIPGQGTYIQESTSECINKWNNKSKSLSLST